MNKPELSARIATETSLSTAGADGAVAGPFSTIDEALASRQTDRITGFISFSMRSWAARHSRNPRSRARALPSTPQRRLQSRLARPSARPSNSGFGERECRTVPMRTGMNTSGSSSGALSAPPVRRRSLEIPNPATRQESTQPNRKSLRSARAREMQPSHGRDAFAEQTGFDTYAHHCGRLELEVVTVPGRDDCTPGHEPHTPSLYL